MAVFYTVSHVYCQGGGGGGTAKNSSYSFLHTKFVFPVHEIVYVLTIA